MVKKCKNGKKCQKMQNLLKNCKKCEKMIKNENFVKKWKIC
jgi:hypothetical protein